MPHQAQWYRTHFNTSLRKLRNRLSQQAFRKRQNAYIQELEKRMEQTGKSDDERIAALEEENRRLRRQLVSFINKLESAHVALQSLSVAMNKALEGSVCQVSMPALVSLSSVSD